MLMSLRKKDELMVVLNGVVVDLATPLNISRWWNLGFMLFMCLMMQILSGLFLAMDYTSCVDLAFDNMMHTCVDMNMGWVLRGWHASGASLFFIFIYVHIGRGIYFSSFSLGKTWMSGVTIFLCLMATAFLGYVLPWGQMSFWGATVITNLFSAVPVVGGDLVQYLWGDYSVSGSTLSRFFMLHFLLPFVLLFLGGLHVFFLHETGSSNPLGISSFLSKSVFYPFSFFTDMEMLSGSFVYFILFIFLGYLTLVDDPDNFISANPLMAPPHIQPEWYFLFAYAILRAIPSKLGGVISLVGSVLMLYTLPFFVKTNFFVSSLSPIWGLMFWCFFGTVLLLTWIGSRPVEYPYVFVGQVLTVFYFSYYVIMGLLKN